jgi:hypothetical protein
MTIFFTSMETPDASTARWTIRKRPEQQGTVMMATVRDFTRAERKSPPPLTCFPFFCYNGPGS